MVNYKKILVGMAIGFLVACCIFPCVNVEAKTSKVSNVTFERYSRTKTRVYFKKVKGAKRYKLTFYKKNDKGKKVACATTIVKAKKIKKSNSKSYIQTKYNANYVAVKISYSTTNKGSKWIGTSKSKKLVCKHEYEKKEKVTKTSKVIGYIFYDHWFCQACGYEGTWTQVDRHLNEKRNKFWGYLDIVYALYYERFESENPGVNYMEWISENEEYYEEDFMNFMTDWMLENTEFTKQDLDGMWQYTTHCCWGYEDKSNPIIIELDEWEEILQGLKEQAISSHGSYEEAEKAGSHVYFYYANEDNLLPAYEEILETYKECKKCGVKK